MYEFSVNFCKNNLSLITKTELFHIISFSHNFGLNISIIHRSKIIVFKRLCDLRLVGKMFKTKLSYLWLSFVRN